MEFTEKVIVLSHKGFDFNEIAKLLDASYEEVRHAVEDESNGDTSNDGELTEESFLSKVRVLINRLEQPILKRAKAIFNSGGVDPENFKDDYRLPMIVMAVLLEELADQHRPNDSANKSTYNNLKHF